MNSLWCSMTRDKFSAHRMYIMTSLSQEMRFDGCRDDELTKLSNTM